MNKKKLAVIGSGISGLSASFFLSKKFEVCLLEKSNYLGGHTRTIKVSENNNEVKIDTGFIVFNENNYPYFKNFLKYLDIESLKSDMSFSFSINNLNFEYGGSNFNALFAQRKNLFSFRYLFLLYEIRKLYNICNNLSLKNDYKNISVEKYLNINNFSQDIRNFHIYPIISSIWSSEKNDIKNFPFISFLNFFKNHGLFKLKNRPIWKSIKEGSDSYVKKLISKNYFTFKTNYNVKKIFRDKNKIILRSTNGEEMIADKLVLATHADQSLALIQNPSESEKKILSKFKYNKNKAYLHSDEKFMPKYKSAWSSWNFKGNNINDSKFSLTYWMNNLQKINSSKNYFVTINPKEVPVDYYDSTTFEHPIYNLKTIESQKNLLSIQGISNTFYCGSYCGYGFHEDGIQSAAYVANILNVEIPLDRNINFKSRLYY